MQRFIVAVLLAALVTLLPAAHAVAGIADTPLPVLVAGQTTQFLYSVPGVLDLVSLGTFFVCTSTDTVAQQVGVDVFDDSGAPCNDAGATSVTVQPGRTVKFGTRYPANEIVVPPMTLVGGCGNGASVARILSTSKKLICTAYVGDLTNSPPATSWQLTIIAKLKQKAAN